MGAHSSKLWPYTGNWTKSRGGCSFMRLKYYDNLIGSPVIIQCEIVLTINLSSSKLWYLVFCPQPNCWVHLCTAPYNYVHTCIFIFTFSNTNTMYGQSHITHNMNLYSSLVPGSLWNTNVYVRRAWYLFSCDHIITEIHVGPELFRKATICTLFNQLRVQHSVCMIFPAPIPPQTAR